MQNIRSIEFRTHLNNNHSKFTINSVLKLITTQKLNNFITKATRSKYKLNHFFKSKGWLSCEVMKRKC